MKENIKYAAEP